MRMSGSMPWKVTPRSRLRTALFARIDAGDLIAVTSELTLAEVLVKPFADGNEQLQQRYLEALQERPALHLVPLSREVLLAAARLRAQCPSLKMPDALHAATALEHDSRYFVSNDARFATVPGIEWTALSG